MKHPDWLTFVVLALAAFRITRLVGWDDLTIPIRRRVCGMSDAEHHTVAHLIDEMQQHGLDPWDEEDRAALLDRLRDDQAQLAEQHEVAQVGTYPESWQVPVSPRRFYLSKLLHCPWCAGFWISLAWIYAWWAFSDVIWTISVPFAVSAIVGLVAKQLDP